jgi:hypothetical protein
MIAGIFVFVALPIYAQEGLANFWVSASPAQYKGSCPASIEFSTKIQVTSPQTVINKPITYWWTRSDGTKTAEQTMVFRPGMNPLKFQDTLKLGKNGQHIDITDSLHLNHGTLKQVKTSPKVHVACQ